DDCPGAHRESAEPGPRGGEGFAAVQPAADDRPQDHRPDVHGRLVRVLHRGRVDGPADARGAGPPGAAV
ncbi:MAG: Cytochrome c oxidase polypeptide I, partial [uncultured Blastococcus sp.]